MGGKVSSLAEMRARLNAPRLEVRRAALRDLVAARQAGLLPCQEHSDIVNMHCHTFYSYNAYGHSPSSLAWLATERGWHAVGKVDFDVLDGIAEALEALDCVEVRGAAGIETRAFVPEFAQKVINSPGEPGICYHIGMGFTSESVPTAAAAVIREMRAAAERRNREMVARINAYLGPVVLDYDRDVLPLTPAGNATERHILVAYDAAARRVFPERDALVEFWARKLGVPPETVSASLGERPAPNDLIRSRIMKQGGVGYVQPDEATFPRLAEVVRAIIACGGIPVVAWLDGTSEGEQHMDEMLELMISLGAAAINIIPERNWNISDPAEREVKVRELHKIIALAQELCLPILVGTEMNKPGQPLADNFGAEPLRPYLAEFIRGANWVYGHTLMERASGRGYQSDWAREKLPERAERNAFYSAVGALVEPGAEAVQHIAGLDLDSPEAILSALERGQVH